MTTTSPPTSEGLQTEEQPLMLPPAETLHHLYEYALIGDILELRATLDRLIEDDPACIAFVGKVKAWTDHYKIAEIRTFLQPHQQDAPVTIHERCE